MTLRIGWCVLFSLMAATPAWAQTQPWRGQNSSGRSIEPDQPVRPQLPTLVQRAPQQPAAQPGPQQLARVPFTLSPQEQAEVDNVLNRWEARNRDIKTLDIEFTRWTYDFVFNPPKPNEQPEPKFTEKGVIRYQAPDKGLFRLDASIAKDGKETPIDNARANHWVCDGKSVFEYSPTKKQVIEHILPKELQGKAIADGPLPFLFGAEAKKLRERYWIRLNASNGAKDQIELVAYPRYQQDAANFDHVVFIISAPKMEPYALLIIQPNGKDKTSYRFQNIVVNELFKIFSSNPFRAPTPLGWQRVVETPPAPAQAIRRPNGQR